MSRHFLLTVGHKALGFLDKSTAAAQVLFLITTTELLLGHIVIGHVAHGSLLLEVHLLFTLLSHHFLLLSTHLVLHHAITLLRLVFGALSLLILSLPLFAFFFLGPPALLLFFLVHALSLFRFRGSGSLGLCLSASLFLSGGCCVRSTVVLFLLASFVAADYFGDIRCTVDVRGGSTELHLQVEISVLGHLAREHHRRLDVDLLSVHHLCETDRLDEPGQFLLLVSERFGVQIVSLVQTLTVAGLGHRRREDIVQVAERRLGQQLFVHLGLLEKLLVHPRGLLPVVSHIL